MKILFDRLRDYFVADLIYEESRVIFVLESPHTQEIKDGYPVAGKSGKDMSNILFGKDEPFGKLIYDREIKNMGILNVSNYPLQNSAYGSKDLQEIEFFEKIRQNPKLRKHDKLGINPIVEKIMQDFKQRLGVHRDKQIVLCGNFAQDAFDSIFDSSEFASVLRVPHPSFNNWKKERYRDVIRELKEALE